MGDFHKHVWAASSALGSLKTCSADTAGACSFGLILWSPCPLSELIHTNHRATDRLFPKLEEVTAYRPCITHICRPLVSKAQQRLQRVEFLRNYLLVPTAINGSLLWVQSWDRLSGITLVSVVSPSNTCSTIYSSVVLSSSNHTPSPKKACPLPVLFHC